jgi:hypothetical protein
MSGILQHMRQSEDRLKLSMYSALNSAWVVSLTLLIVLALWFVAAQR